MGGGRVGRSTRGGAAESRTASAPAPPAAGLAGPLSPRAVARLQSTIGNAAVQRVVQDDHGRRLARLRTSQQFVKKSKLVGRGRSQPLQDVDAALAAYDAVRGGTDLGAREAALYDLTGKIGAWKHSKAAWAKTARAKYITALELEQQAELNLVLAAKAAEKQARDAAALKRKTDAMNALVAKVPSKTTDATALARALFTAYMDEFRGKATYTTTTPKDTTVWDGKGTVACAMISNGLIDLLRHAGLQAKLREVDPKNFVTKKLGAKFIDPGTEGNVRVPGGTFAAEKRFFFNKHWIVEVEAGALYLDPTSGIEVDKNATQIIEYGPMAAEPVSPPAFSDSTWRVHHVGNNRLGDGAYELTKPGG